MEREYPVTTLRFDLIGVDLDRHRNRAVEAAGEPFAAMQCCVIAVFDRLAASDADRATFDLNLKVGLADAGDLGEDQDVIALPEDVQWRVSAAAAGPGVEPIARPERINRPLKLG
jgi:hypothetical protein